MTGYISSYQICEHNPNSVIYEVNGLALEKDLFRDAHEVIHVIRMTKISLNVGSWHPLCVSHVTNYSVILSLLCAAILKM